MIFSNSFLLIKKEKSSECLFTENQFAGYLTVEEIKNISKVFKNIFIALKMYSQFQHRLQGIRLVGSLIIFLVYSKGFKNKCTGVSQLNSTFLTHNRVFATLVSNQIKNLTLEELKKSFISCSFHFRVSTHSMHQFYSQGIRQPGNACSYVVLVALTRYTLVWDCLQLCQSKAQ